MSHDIDVMKDVFVEFTFKVYRAQGVCGEVVNILLHQEVSAVGVRCFNLNDVIILWTIIEKIVFEFGNSEMLFAEFQLLFALDGALCLNPIALRNADDSCCHNAIGNIAPFKPWRFVTKIQILAAHGFQKAHRHIFIDIRNVLVSVKNGSVCGRVVFHAGAEQREPKKQYQCSD